jgi:transposase
MEVMYKRCCGLDIHKKSIYACVLIKEEGRREKHLARFGTMTADILQLAAWLRDWGVERVGMESTGVYWKPIWNLLEEEFDLELINAEHIKKVPGRKTDVKDSEWIAELLQHGLVRGSFVPIQPQRDLRELTRMRVGLCEDKARVANRIQKVLEDANIKLASVATDVLGASGRAILEAMIEGEKDAEKLANMAKHILRKKIPQLQQALTGKVRDHHRFLLRKLLEQVKFLEGQIEEIDRQVREQISPFQWAITLLKSIPGVSEITAWVLVAEIGVLMEQFGEAANLASWAGMCPGNWESAGKRLRGTTRGGNRWLRRALNQAGWAATRKKGSYLGVRFRRLAARRGVKRALVATAHKILIIAYYLLKNQCSYSDLGETFLEQKQAVHVKRSLVRRLERLGYRVTLEELTQAT